MALLGAGCGRLPRQPPPRVYRIGFLAQRPEATPAVAGSPTAPAFRDGLRELGYVEDQHYFLALRSSDGRDPNPSLADLVAELVDLPSDVIVARGPAALRAAADRTVTIPIVMVAASTDPIDEGYVASYARPGRNVTGLTGQSNSLHGKRVELLSEAVAGVGRLGVLLDAAVAPDPAIPTWRLTQSAAGALGIAVQPLPLGGPESLEAAYQEATRARLDALVVAGTAMFLSPATRAKIADLALEHRLPRYRVGPIKPGTDY